MNVGDPTLVPAPETLTIRRPPGGLLRRATRLWRTKIGLCLVSLLVVIALFGPLVAPHSATEFVGAPNTPRSQVPPFGTDYLGQDVFSRFLRGGSQILITAVAATALALILGVAVGLIAAYSGGLADDALMRGMDVILAFPQIMLALVLMAMVGPKVWLLVLAVGLTTMPRISRVTRAAAQPIVESDFIAALEALRMPRRRILVGEILPNILGPLMAETSLRLTSSVGLIAGLAFLGFATNPTGADWGLMTQENQLSLVVQPWGVVLPACAIALLAIGAGLVGDGIARAAAGLDRTRGAV